MVKRLRLERHDRRTSFLELWVEGDRLMRQWGPLNAAPVAERAEVHASPARAHAAMWAQARRALGKGFWLGRHHPGLIAAILENPDDRSGYLIYGDWLLEHHDPRGDLIIADAKEVQDRIINTHRMQLAPPHWDEFLSVIWRYGFVGGLRVRIEYFWGHTEWQKRLQRVFRHPSMHFLRVVQARLISHPYNRNGLSASWRVRDTQAVHELVSLMPASVERVGINAATTVDLSAVVGSPKVEVVPVENPTWLSDALAAFS